MYKVIGSKPIRIDGVGKVTGKAIYGADVKLPRMAYGKVLRSPHAHARIKAIDTSRAETLPGVLAVVTWRDLWPEYASSTSLSSVKPKEKYFHDHYLASDKALYCGHPIAAVAAVDPYIAEEAIALIDVEYELLPPVLDVQEAMKESSPLLHETMTTRSLGKSSGRKSNVARHIQHLKGNPEKGFSEADVVVEREFRTATVHQGYIEPQVTTAAWDADGVLTIWSPCQAAFYIQTDMGKLLGLPMSKIRVIPTEVGGGFGGKNANYLEPLAALLSRKSGRPVRLSMTRAEVFQATGPSPGSYIKVKVGATRDGRLTAATALIAFEAGAFAIESWAATSAQCVFAPYDIPHGQIDAYDVVVNKPRSGSYRGPGATQSTYAAEIVIDEVCEAIGMDPLEFRLKNVAKEGTRRIDGVVYPKVGFEETMRAAMDHEHYSSPCQGGSRGRGVACGWWPNFGMTSACSIAVNTDGTVNVTMGSIEIGGGTRTVIAMQVAEELGIPLDQVQCVTADTNSIGYTAETGGSRTTFATGLAAIQAARDILQQMSARAATIWGVDPTTVNYSQGIFTTSTDGEKKLTFKEIAAKSPNTGGYLFASSSATPQGVGSAMGAHIVDVEVDPETGKVRILRYTAAQDAGTAVHPQYVEGQIQGGVVQGIGWALSEGYQFDRQGTMLNQTFLDYRLPTAADLPWIDTVLVEVPNPGHPYGVRGVGETPIVPPPAAIANAIYRAVGVRMTELPITPGRILEKMGIIQTNDNRTEIRNETA